MIASAWGKEGSGKSTFGLTYPKPLFHLDLDLGGFERAIWRIAEQAKKDGSPLRILRLSPPDPDEEETSLVIYDTKMKIADVPWDDWDIVSKPYLPPIQLDKLMGIQGSPKVGATVRFPRQVVGIKEMWQDITLDMVTVGQTKQVRTIMPDSATQQWWICHTGFLQEKQEIQISKGMKVDDEKFREKLQPVEYPNNRMRDLVYTIRSFGVHLIMTHYPKDVYATSPAGVSYTTGEILPDGFKHTVTLDDIVIWCWAEIDKVKELSQVIEDANGKKSMGKVSNPTYNKPQPHAQVSLKCGLSGMGMAAVGLDLPAPTYAGLMELRAMMRGEV